MSTDYAWSVAPFARRIRAILLTGGSSVGDTNFVLKAGQIQIAKLYNITTDDVALPEDMIKCGLYVPPNVPLYGAVGETAAGSGSVYLHLDIVPSRIPVIGGEVFMKTVAAATCVVNYDFMDDEAQKSSTLNRVLRAIGLTGSTASGDTILECSVGNMMFSEVYNTSTGLAIMQHLDMMPMTQFLAAGRELEIKCIDAAASNAVMLCVVFGGVSRRGGFRARRRW